LIKMDIYSENIMEHYKDPRNFGKLENENASYKDSNPLCGDKIEISLSIRNDKIIDINCISEGCAISRASSSIISEKIKGMGLNDALKSNKDFVLDSLGIQLNPIRLKCAMLSLRAIQKAIAKYLMENKNAGS